MYLQVKLYDIVSFLILLFLKWRRICIKCNGKSSSSQQCIFLPSRFFISAFQKYWWKVLLNLICAIGVFVCMCVSVCVHSQGKCNFILVARYSLKFTRCSLLVAKSLFTRCRSCSLQKFTCYLLQSLLVTRCRSSSLQKITRYRICS